MPAMLRKMLRGMQWIVGEAEVEMALVTQFWTMKSLLGVFVDVVAEAVDEALEKTLCDAFDEEDAIEYRCCWKDDAVDDLLDCQHLP